jgi:hypothetical protein
MIYAVHLSAKQKQRNVSLSRGLDRQPRRYQQLTPVAQCPHRRASNGSFLFAVWYTNINAFTGTKDERSTSRGNVYT